MIPAFRFFVATLLALAFAGAVAAQQRESRPVLGFSAIAISVPVKLQLIQGSGEALTLEGPREALDNIETVVENGTLHLRPRKPAFHWPPGKIRATVNARSMESIAISGSADLTADALRGPSLKVSISGSGNVRIGALEADRTEVAISGSGDVRLAGRVPALSARISGSGDVDAKRLESQRVQVSIAGSGDAAVWARESLAVRIAGSGDVRYLGEPAIEKAILGSGSVKRLEASRS